jgi:hypothetical protein
MDRNQTTAAASESGVAVPPAQVTWISHVLVPLTQNLLGGVAVAGLGIIGMQAATGEVTPSAALWCALGGGLVTCVVTVMRFFGDDFGLYSAAYKAGRRSRDAEMDNLNKQLHVAKTALESAGIATSAEFSRRVIVGQIAVRNARVIVTTAYGGGNYSRTKMGGQMGDKDWGRAMRLLRVVGIFDDSNSIRRERAPSIKEAFALMDEVEKREIPLLANDRYVPGWW